MSDVPKPTFSRRLGAIRKELDNGKTGANNPSNVSTFSKVLGISTGTLKNMESPLFKINEKPQVREPIYRHLGILGQGEALDDSHNQRWKAIGNAAITLRHFRNTHFADAFGSVLEKLQRHEKVNAFGLRKLMLKQNQHSRLLPEYYSGKELDRSAIAGAIEALAAFTQRYETSHPALCIKNEADLYRVAALDDRHEQPLPLPTDACAIVDEFVSGFHARQQSGPALANATAASNTLVLAPSLATTGGKQRAGEDKALKV